MDFSGLEMSVSEVMRKFPKQGRLYLVCDEHPRDDGRFIGVIASRQGGMMHVHDVETADSVAEIRSWYKVAVIARPWEAANETAPVFHAG